MALTGRVNQRRSSLHDHFITCLYLENRKSGLIKAVALCSAVRETSSSFHSSGREDSLAGRKSFHNKFLLQNRICSFRALHTVLSDYTILALLGVSWYGIDLQRQNEDLMFNNLPRVCYPEEATLGPSLLRIPKPFIFYEHSVLEESGTIKERKGAHGDQSKMLRRKE